MSSTVSPARVVAVGAVAGPGGRLHVPHADHVRLELGVGQNARIGHLRAYARPKMEPPQTRDRPTLFLLGQIGSLPGDVSDATAKIQARVVTRCSNFVNVVYKSQLDSVQQPVTNP